MIRYEWLYFQNNYLNNYPGLFTVHQLDSRKELLKINFYKLRAIAVNSDNKLIFEDANGQRIQTSLILDNHTEPDDICLVPMSTKLFGDGKIYPTTGVGYQSLGIKEGKLDAVNMNCFQTSSSIIKGRYINITERIIIEVSDYDAELPDEFFSYYNLERKETEQYSEGVQAYLDSLTLLDYDAKYKVVEEISDLPEVKKNYSRKPQTFDSRQSKVYIFSKDMKEVLKKTNALLADHKIRQFGMEAMEFRQLENKKLLELLAELGYKKEDVCFAKKEVGAIRVCIDEENKIEVKARFAEINFYDHMTKNDLRYLQNGDIIELRDNGEWWFIDE